MAQHIRAQPKHIRKREKTATEKAEGALQNAANATESFLKKQGFMHIRLGPKHMIGTILIIILCIVLVLVALHYFRVFTLPFKFIPQKEFTAPASHLQYFFF